MAHQIDAMLVLTMTKGGCQHVFKFFVPLSLSYDPEREGSPFKVNGITVILSSC